jgi:GR25 family glycosyltransferase involved in LPS biosynthesis
MSLIRKIHARVSESRPDTIQGFYINLNRRTDRRKDFEKECQQIGIVVEHFAAVEHRLGGYGCLQSHIQVLKLARERRYPTVMIFEDDFQFLVSRNEFKSILASMPAEFDVMMLSYNLLKSKPYNERFGRCLEVQTTSGYVVHQRFYDTLLANLEEALELFTKDLTHTGYQKYAIDQYWKRLQPTSNWFYSLRRVGRQQAGYSDVENMVVDYKV